MKDLNVEMKATRYFLVVLQNRGKTRVNMIENLETGIDQAQPPGLRD